MKEPQPGSGHAPAQLLQWKVDALKSWFENYQSPTAEQFIWFINQCADGIECHEH
ncbi:MAG: hypothetical protein H8D74_00380, partial [Chloroflexi bacterium]|nr:hypothetical protein [Chloroflexota bacterium]